MPLETFHPAVAAWFDRAFPAPTPAQAVAWPAIRSGRHVLVAAPTGSGKTFAAFLASIDALVRRGIEGAPPDETAIVYVSPLKALSNDIRINLEAPLEGIREELARRALPDVEIRTAVRTGDTTQAERTQMRKRPPHIVVTTPESLYVLLGSESGRAMLSTTQTVIVDEIHALIESKRGSHLALTLERLEALCGRRLVRVGLSATQKPIDEVARFLVGTSHIDANGVPDCAIVDVGHARERDLAIEVPPAPLEAVMSHEIWALVYDRLATLIREHRTTLVFVNTRRMAERLARQLSERLGKEVVTAHHGSLSKEHRLDAEQRLKRGELKVLVATASLELGIDIGDVDLVCQLGSPRTIAAFLQRVGRSGHAVGGTPKGRLFPQSRDDLAECVALLDAVRRGELDALEVFENPLDVLAQQIVAETAMREWKTADLLALARRAYPYATLAERDFEEVVATLAAGYTTKRGPRAALIHRDAVNGLLRGRRAARLTAITSGGAIPDTADYDVILEPDATKIGTINEDFAVESLAGDIFQLGNASYRVLKVEQSRVRVDDAHGAPPSIPFWLGEAPGRTNELSASVSRMRETIAAKLAAGTDAAIEWLITDVGIDEAAARQLVEHYARTLAALGVLPTQTRLAMERFFDESGGTQLVIHSPYGSRINRAWGLALRKRFCRTFNFELQAAATEDAIVLSLSTSHSFPLIDVAHYLHSVTVRDVLIQALLDAPMFGVRWRWNASVALALPRWSGGRKTPPQIMRMRSEDLLASVFPDQVACAENLVGEREIPDHPLVKQTIDDCLEDAMDLDGLVALLRGLESGAIAIEARDLAAPSPLAAEVLGARPYAYLDDAPLEERRTRAVMERRYGDPQDVTDLAKLDPEAIAAVRAQAWPEARDADELHEAIMGLGFVTDAELRANGEWPGMIEALITQGRVTRFCGRGESPASVAAVGAPALPTATVPLWVVAERLPELRSVVRDSTCEPALRVPAEFERRTWTREAALVELVRARLSGLGPTRAADVTAPLGIETSAVDLALLALESEGYVMRGRFTADADGEEWCERHLLARIHRYTVGRLRREIEPVEPRDYLRFLFEWQRVAPGTQVAGPDALTHVVAQLEGYDAPAASWESSLLPARVADYDIAWLDELCRAGRVAWTRPLARTTGATPVRTTPIVLVMRRNVAAWNAVQRRAIVEEPALSSRAQALAEYLDEHGASFFDELAGGTRMLRAELEDALGQLVAAGRVTADSFAGLRALLLPAEKRGGGRRGRRRALFGIEDAGRWSLIRRRAGDADEAHAPEHVEHVARTLLRRYGVVCFRVIERERDMLPPWRDLLRVYHRLEARGEIRGGRFVAGISGEQFALPEAIAPLRRVRQTPRDGTLVCVAGTDPLNLVGIVAAGSKVPAVSGSRVLYRDGLPVATLVAGEMQLLAAADEREQWALKLALFGREAQPIE